jgi:hypothetical protein
MMKFDITIYVTVGILKMTIFADCGVEAQERAIDYATSRNLEVEDLSYVGYRI